MSRGADPTTIPQRLASFAGSRRFLRITWILWLTTFLPLYAYPVLVYAWVGRPAQGLVEADRWRRVVMSTADWSWDEIVCIPLLLAVVLPIALHAALARRIQRPFTVARDAAAMPLDYRSARPLTMMLSPRAARSLIAIHAGRLGLAMACSYIPFWVLTNTRFFENYGCVAYPYVRSAPEHLFFVTLLLAVTAFHVPTAWSVLGAEPRISRGNAVR